MPTAKRRKWASTLGVLKLLNNSTKGILRICILILNVYSCKFNNLTKRALCKMVHLLQHLSTMPTLQMCVQSCSVELLPDIH